MCIYAVQCTPYIIHKCTLYGVNGRRWYTIYVYIYIYIIYIYIYIYIYINDPIGASTCVTWYIPHTLRVRHTVETYLAF